MIFAFVAAKKAEHSIQIMCRVLEVSRSGYYAWAGREPSARAAEDERLTDRINELFKLRRDVYGSPRIWPASCSTTASVSGASASSDSCARPA